MIVENACVLLKLMTPPMVGLRMCKTLDHSTVAASLFVLMSWAIVQLKSLRFFVPVHIIKRTASGVEG